MMPSHRDRKEEHFAILRNYKIKAREFAWQLNKDGYIVEFFNRYPKKSNRAKLHFWQLEDFEIIRVYECINKRCKTIIDDTAYKKFFRFYAMVQRYKHEYGKKKLHEHTGEILKELKL